MISLLVVAGLLIAGDLFAKGFASERMAEQVKANLALEEEPDIELGGFPFVTQVAAGELESVRVSLEDLSHRGVTLTSLGVTLDRVRFSLANLLDQNARKLRVASTSGEAELDEADLDVALQSAGAPFKIRFDQARMLATSPVIGQGVEIDVRVEGRRLVLSVPNVEDTELPLPRPMEGITYDSVEIIPDGLRLRFSSGRTTLRAPR